MKNILLILLTLTVNSELFSQNEELRKIYTEIDSIIEVESQYFKSRNNYSTLYWDGYNKYGKYEKNKFNRKFEKETMAYLEQYMFDSLPNINRVIQQLMFSVSYVSKNTKVKQKAINNFLSMYNLPYSSRDYSFKFKAKDYNKQAQNQIKELIAGRKTQFEIDMWAEFDYKYALLDTGSWGRQIRFLSKKDSLPEEFVRDSLFAKLKESQRRGAEAWDLPGEPERLIKLTGRIYMYDYIPELEKLLEDKRYNYYKRYIKLALARLGVEKYENEFLKKASGRELLYINSKRSILKYAEKLYSNETGAYRPYDDAVRPLSYTAFIILQEWIQNFPDDLKTTQDEFKFGEEEVKKLEKAKKWIEKNKNNLKLNKEMYR